MQNNRSQFTLQIRDEGAVEIKNRTERSKRKTASSLWYYLGIVGHIGFAIAIPIAGGGILGSYIDEQASSYPRATLSWLMIGVGVGITAFIRTLNDILKTEKNT